MTANYKYTRSIKNTPERLGAVHHDSNGQRSEMACGRFTTHAFAIVPDDGNVRSPFQLGCGPEWTMIVE